MRRVLLAGVFALAAATAAQSQTAVPLSTYADANGNLDVQKLTCAPDALTAWYRGWYNGLARKHHANIGRAKLVEHEIIVHCKAHREKKVIEAIAVVFKDERAKLGIEMK
jgi:hypothetical protein